MTATVELLHDLASGEDAEREELELWKTRRVARLLDVSPETVLRYYRHGQLRGYRLAGQRNVLRFRRRDVLAFIGDQETPQL